MKKPGGQEPVMAPVSHFFIFIFQSEIIPAFQ